MSSIFKEKIYLNIPLYVRKTCDIRISCTGKSISRISYRCFLKCARRTSLSQTFLTVSPHCDVTVKCEWKRQIQFTPYLLLEHTQTRVRIAFHPFLECQSNKCFFDGNIHRASESQLNLQSARADMLDYTAEIWGIKELSVSAGGGWSALWCFSWDGGPRRHTPASLDSRQAKDELTLDIRRAQLLPRLYLEVYMFVIKFNRMENTFLWCQYKIRTVGGDIIFDDIHNISPIWLILASF